MDTSMTPSTDVCREENGQHTQKYQIDNCIIKLVYPAATSNPEAFQSIQEILLGQQHVPAG